MAAAKLLLKARPTPAQLADRLRPIDGIWPDGIELYLAAADLADQSTLDEIVTRLNSAQTPPDFAWLIEGPVDSLDGKVHWVVSGTDSRAGRRRTGRADRPR